MGAPRVTPSMLPKEILFSAMPRSTPPWGWLNDKQAHPFYTASSRRRSCSCAFFLLNLDSV